MDIMSHTQTPWKDFKSHSYPGDVQTLSVHSEDVKKFHIPKPPEGPKKPVLNARVPVHKTPPTDEIDNAVRESDTGSQPLDYTGSMGLRFDDQGMVLPHSILGSLEDFRSYLEARRDTELLMRIPKSQGDYPWEASGRHHTQDGQNAFGVPSGHRSIQSNALQHWHTHMNQRRRQQNFLSGSLNRPVQNLLMNKDNHFRETQEQRELLSQALPHIYPGYGYRVGSEFWSLPQRFGDEMSGIATTLTQTERGKREPVTHIGQPSSILQESGNISAETQHPASWTWDQSVYLQQQYQELKEVLKDMDIKKLDIDGLEVIGSGKPFTDVTVSHSSMVEKEDEKKQVENDLLAQHDDALHISALRFCGQLATWTGNSISNQGDVGLCARLNFEALTGEKASSHLELHNEGNTAIHYTWQQLSLPHSFPNLSLQTTTPHFYFNSSTGVILPGETQIVEFIFKSKVPGIKTELWQLNTHPVLQGGAPIQLTLWGVALYQDTTADQRQAIEMKLEKAVMVKICRSVAYSVLQGVQTPERPSSPAELYITEEQAFVNKNPKLQYFYQPVENLKKLWQETTSEHTWDLSVDTLRQAVMSLPEQEPTEDTLTREKGLASLNSLILQLSEPLFKHNFLTAVTVGKQLWVKLLDSLASEAMWLGHLLGLPENETWTEKEHESLIPDSEKDEMHETKESVAAKEERSEESARVKDDNKRESKPATTEKLESKKRERRRDEMKKRHGEKQGKELASLSDVCPESVKQTPDDHDIKPEVMDKYRGFLHQKVYALLEDLVDTLCDLVDELKERERQEPEPWPIN
ncbi:hypothetical protein LDENG_00197000 [Lucifuga dentata]|nr:hypothetical protein LDENG_00197000 [Lucifuga dentata]